MVEFVFGKHVGLAVDSMLLFVVGVFVAWPVVRYRIRPVMRPPVALFHAVIRLLGSSPTMLRMTLTIFLFNLCAMFVYMASGVHPILPKILGIWTGLNIAIILTTGRHGKQPVYLEEPAPGSWVPWPGLAVACAPLVPLIELPCFWLTIAMGISMGHAVQAGAPYGEALAVRAVAYLAVIAPLLLISALAESVAIRGSAAHTGQIHTDA